MKKWTKNQENAIYTTDRDLIVSASAGTGKTSAMVERAINLIINKKVPIEKIMLLTFTNNSAGEMKERLRDKLMEYAKDHPESIELVREQLDNIGLADISTIDSFCFKIVKEFFEVVGLSPSVGTQSPDEESEDKAKAGENTIKICEQDKGIREMMDRLSLRSDDTFLKVIKKLYEYLTTQPDRDAWLRRAEEKYADGLDFEESEVSKFVAEYYSKICELYANELRDIFTNYQLNELGDEKEKEKNYLLVVLSAVEPFEHCQKLSEVFNAYKESKAVEMVAPRGNIDRDIIKRITPIRDEFKSLRDRLDSIFDSAENYETILKNRNESGKHVREIIKAVRIFGEEYDKIKAEQNKIDFADMERYAMEILKNPEIAEEITNRHEYVFVDEYQDTNYLQDTLIRKITKPDRLFVVGDVKQAIYRFRMAEPKIFLDTMKEWGKDNNKFGKLILFNENFRSDNAILDFVNRIFDCLMTLDFGNIDYKDNGHFAMKENKDENEVAPVTILKAFSQSTEKNDEENSQNDCTKSTNKGEKEKSRQGYVDENGIYDIRKHDLKGDEKNTCEAGLIYNYIQSVLGKTIYVDGNQRTVEYRDIVLMYCDRKAPKGTLELLSSAGIPLNVGDFSANVGEKELDVFMNFLQTINNVYDDYCLIGSLHSFIGGLSNVELATIKLKSESRNSFYETCLNYVERFDDDLGKKLARFLGKIDKYRFLSSTMEMTSFLKYVFEESGYSTFVASREDGERIVSAINSYIENARGKKYARDLHSYLKHYEKDTEKKLTSISSDADGVKVSTMHGSKGLEYPIVICAGLNTKDGGGGGEGIVSDIDFGIGVKYYDPTDRSQGDTIDMKVIGLKKKKEEREEDLRLLYVALTRAKVALCVVMPEIKEKCLHPFATSSMAKWIDYAIDHNNALESKILKMEAYKFDANENKATGNLREEKYDCPEELEPSQSLKNAVSYVYPHEIATKTARKYSVSELNSGEKTLMLPTFDPDDRSIVGTTHHLVMQHINFFARTKAEVEEEIKRLCDEGILEQGVSDKVVVENILDCLNSEIGDLARAGLCYREQKFVLAKKGDDVLSNGYQEDVLVQGIIDLVIDGDQLVVVDFKHSKAKAETLKERYTTQLKLYADAVWKKYGKYPDRLLLYVFGGKEKIIEIE